MVAQSFLAALGDLPALRRLVGRSVGLALLLLIAASAGLVWLAVRLLPDTVGLPWTDRTLPLDNLAGWALVPVLLVASVIVVVPVASAISALFADEVADVVEARHYPTLPPASPPGWAAGAVEAARGFGLLLLGNLAIVAGYLAAAPLAPVLFVAVNGWLLGRELYRGAALRRRDDPAARLAANRGRVWALGALCAAPMLVPVLNLVVPVLAAAAFTHLYRRTARI